MGDLLQKIDLTGVIKIIFLFSYILLSISLSQLNIDNTNSLLFYAALLICIIISNYFLVPILITYKEHIELKMYFEAPFLLILVSNPTEMQSMYPLIPLGIIYLVIIVIIHLTNLRERITRMNNFHKIYAIFLVHILSASYITSIILSRTYIVDGIIPLIFFGLLLGWLAPETLYRFFSKGATGYIVIVGLYSFIPVLTNAISQFFLQEYYVMSLSHIEIRFIGVLPLISMPTLLISRIVYEHAVGLVDNTLTSDKQPCF